MINNKGSAMYFSVVIMAIVLSIVLGMSTIILKQIKMTQGSENSVMAFYMADAGVERALFYLYHELGSETVVDHNISYNNNEFKYDVDILPSGNTRCNRAFYCIVSTGTFRDTRRALEVGN
ncbi:MAG: hypothetical protein PHV25_01180 [Candidatus Pacebacteria bacterium]|nr:hypothetical protein [Candidatus Paceibacterota bacterium]